MSVLRAEAHAVGRVVLVTQFEAAPLVAVEISISFVSSRTVSRIGVQFNVHTVFDAVVGGVGGTHVDFGFVHTEAITTAAACGNVFVVNGDGESKGATEGDAHSVLGTNRTR
jgi:hypothetical protein